METITLWVPLEPNQTLRRDLTTSSFLGRQSWETPEKNEKVKQRKDSNQKVTTVVTAEQNTLFNVTPPIGEGDGKFIQQVLMAIG